MSRESKALSFGAIGDKLWLTKSTFHALLKVLNIMPRTIRVKDKVIIEMYLGNKEQVYEK